MKYGHIVPHFLYHTLLEESKKEKAELYSEVKDEVDSLLSNISKESLAKSAITEVNSILRAKYGELPEVIDVKINNKEPKRLLGLFHSQFKNILTLLLKGKNVLLVGESGAGKNVLGKQLSESLGVDFYCTPAIKDEYKVSGFVDANGRMVETPFYKAWTNGGLYLLDELDASNANALLELNSALANGYYEFPNGLKEKHKDFYIVAAANTLGRGGDRLYVAREELDASSIDRFQFVEFNIDPNLERKLASEPFIYDFVVAVREAVKERGLRYAITMRSTIDLSDLYGELSNDFLIKSSVLKNMTSADIKEVFESTRELSANPLYSSFKKLAERLDYMG